MGLWVPDCLSGDSKEEKAKKNPIMEEKAKAYEPVKWYNASGLMDEAKWEKKSQGQK